MRTYRSKWITVWCLCAVAGSLWACEGFILNITFVAPKRAEATETQNAAMPADAGLVVNNENGSTHIIVDPAATQAEIEITRIAIAEDQAAADDLLTKIVVTVTLPTAEDNNLRISAPKPPEATGNDNDFNFELSEDVLVITGVLKTKAVAVVELRITLPPAHAVDATQTNGFLRAAGLDRASSLTGENTSIRVLDATAAVTAETDTGFIHTRNHAASLDARTRNGSLEIDVQALAAGQQIVGRTQNGHIELDVPHDIDAQLSAVTENGIVGFDDIDFDHIADLTHTSTTVTATLNDGGPTIDLRTENGLIDIDGH